jgi:molybdopterin-containing oxidoreductase family iron-sulfur binding subunit
MAACPYSARTFNWNTGDAARGEHECGASPEAAKARKTGTVDKCDFCIDTVKQGELQPCIKACPNGVFFFGDLNEDTVTNGSETYRFSELVREKAGYRYLEELGTKPSVYYLPPANRQFDFDMQDRLDYIEKKRIKINGETEES